MSKKEETKQVLSHLYIPPPLVSIINSYIDLEGLVSTLPGRYSEGFPAIVMDSRRNLFIANGKEIVQTTSDGDLVTSFSFFNCVSGLTISQDNLYICDYGNRTIKKLNTSDGKIRLRHIGGDGRGGYRDGPGSKSSLFDPRGITVDKEGNLIVADSSNHRIRKITNEKMVSTLAGTSRGFGDGVVASAKFDYPVDVAVDNQDNIYVADLRNDRIRKITSGIVSTIHNISRPRGVKVDQRDNSLYICARCGGIEDEESSGYLLGRLSPIGNWILIAGGGIGQQDGLGIEAGFRDLQSVWIGEDYLYVCDEDRIRKIM